MTISITTNKAAYIGNGVAISFAIPFPFLAQEHLKVYQLLNDIQTERTDWTVSDGNLVFATAPADNAQIVIMREVPLTQETDYRENEILPAETLERCFDKLTMQVQQLAEKSARAVTVDIFDDTQADSLIPSIRKAVSDSAVYAAAAQNKAQEASQKAQNAEQSAQTAADKATIATNKSVEVANALFTKADKDLSNCTKPYVTETYHSGLSWYRVWSDGWIEQGGRVYVNGSSTADINLLKPYSNQDYMVSISHSEAGTGGQSESYAQQTSATYFKLGNCCGNAQYFTWSACGY